MNNFAPMLLLGTLLVYSAGILVGLSRPPCSVRLRWQLIGMSTGLMGLGSAVLHHLVPGAL